MHACHAGTNSFSATYHRFVVNRVIVLQNGNHEAGNKDILCSRIISWRDELYGYRLRNELT
ncbi:hypothetical protein EW785_22260 [Salmonella enterica]|nr:hypothetical protein [Salmonella enterica]